MKASGKRPKCQSNQIRADRFIPMSDRAIILQLGKTPAFHPQRLVAYTCTACRFVELYFDPRM